MIIVNIHVHANYIQTTVRFYSAPLSFVEYGTGDPEAPAKLLNTPDSEALRAVCTEGSFADKPHPDVWQEAALSGFSGVLDMRLSVSDTGVWSVEEARHIDGKTGGKNVVSVFRTQFKDAVLKNLFNTIATRDVQKIETVVKALRTHAGE